jgi:hypothetical protein
MALVIDAQKMFFWGPSGARPAQEVVWTFKDVLLGPKWSSPTRSCLTFKDVLLGPKGAHPVPKVSVSCLKRQHTRFSPLPLNKKVLLYNFWIKVWN